MDALMKIGEVADRVGLSLRTIRFYEEGGLITPDARSTGGFRLYSEVTVERLELIKSLKPLDFSVEEIADILALLDRLGSSDGRPDDTALALEELDGVRGVVEERLTLLQERAERARDLARLLDDVRARHEG